MKACSERGGRGWWTGQSWLEAPLVSVCAGAAFSHSDTKAATDALHTLCFCPWTVCSRWHPKKATASVTWPGSDTFSFWQTNIFFSNKKSYCFNFPRSSPGIFLFISFFIILCLIFFCEEEEEEEEYLSRQTTEKESLTSTCRRDRSLHKGKGREMRKWREIRKWVCQASGWHVSDEKAAVCHQKLLMYKQTDAAGGRGSLVGFWKTNQRGRRGGGR